MPWCPKCKTEYREGFKICADCGSELADEEPVDSPDEGLEEELQAWESAALEAMKKAAGDFGSVESAEAAGAYAGRNNRGAFGTGESAEPRARDAFGTGESAEPMDRGIFGTGESAEPADREADQGGRGLYQDSMERASDNRASAWALLGIGSCGLLLVTLGAMGTLPFHMSNPYLSYGVMGAVFILFVVAGIVSMKNAKIFEKKAESENSLRQTLLDWCRKNLDAASIDAQVCSEGMSDEVAYFGRTACIKEKLNRQFLNLDQDFLDRFVDDYIYEEIFEGKSE